MMREQGLSRAEVNLTAPSQVRALLDRYGLRPNRRLGQHFLIDANVLGKIVAAADLSPEDSVLEIGPGLGTLTRELARRVRRVMAVELDRGLLPVLAETLAGHDHVAVVHGDAVQVDLTALCGPATVSPAAATSPVAAAGGVWKVAANLPYSVTGPVVARLLEYGLFHLMVVMVQQEVAQRMVAAPGSRDYSAFSVLVQYYSEPELVARVPATAFFPPPEVGSAVVRLRVRPAPPVDADPRVFFAIVRAAFGHRRKSLRNALQAGLPPGLTSDGGAEALLRRAGIAGERRGETLSLAEFAVLAGAVPPPAEPSRLADVWPD